MWEVLIWQIIRSKGIWKRRPPQLTRPSSNSIEFVTLDQRIVALQVGLVLALVVEWAVVVLCVSVLSTKDILTLALEAKETNFLFARPTCIFISLLNFISDWGISLFQIFASISFTLSLFWVVVWAADYLLQLRYILDLTLRSLLGIEITNTGHLLISGPLGFLLLLLHLFPLFAGRILSSGLPVFEALWAHEVSILSSEEHHAVCANYSFLVGNFGFHFSSSC